MPSSIPKSQSALLSAVLALDAEFQKLEHLAHEINGLPLHSEAKLERAGKLLGQFETCSQDLGGNLTNLSKALTEARERAEKAAALVSERALAIQNRRDEINRMAERFAKLGTLVKEITNKLAQFNSAHDAEFSEMERKEYLEHLPDFDKHLSMLVDEARQLMLDARAAQMKSMESNADSLRQSLQAARHRLSLFQIEREPGASIH